MTKIITTPVATDTDPNDNRPEGTGANTSANTTAKASEGVAGAPAAEPVEQTQDEAVTAAKAHLADLDADIAELQSTKGEVQTALDTAIKDRDRTIESLAEVAKVEDADIIRRIQRQTGEQAMQRKEAMQKIGLVLAQSGMPTHASALDAALAQGGRRTTALVNGEVVHAANPRSREGASNYAKFLRQEADAHTPAARGLV